MSLFTAYKLTGHPLFSAGDRKTFLDLLGRHFDAYSIVPIIERDTRQHPAPAFPYIAWRKEPNKLVGHPCKTFEEARDYLFARK